MLHQEPAEVGISHDLKWISLEIKWSFKEPSFSERWWFCDTQGRFETFNVVHVMQNRIAVLLHNMGMRL